MTWIVYWIYVPLLPALTIAWYTVCECSLPALTIACLSHCRLELPALLLRFALLLNLHMDHHTLVS